MNKVKAVVEEILGEPYKEYDHWFLPVKANSYGNVQETELMFETKEKAESIEVGYEFKT